MVKLDILSDPICPWCFIGKAELDRALEAHPEHPFEIEWHPFQLNPDMPASGMNRAEYLETKFGGRSGAASAYAPIVERAEKLGLGIDFAGIKRTPNTLNAHRLIHWAGLEGRQTRMVDALFRAYFQNGSDIGDIATLIALAGSVGLDKSLISNLFSGDADTDDIRARDAHARQMGVTGVPTFIVGNRHAVPGAQPASLWADVIKDLLEQDAAD